MNKEPLSLYLLRFFCGFVILIFMGMLYWSSTLIEENIRAIRSDIAMIKSELKTGQAAYRSDRPAFHQEANEQKTLPIAAKNLLKEDIFYKETLPRLLGKDFVPHGIQHEAVFGRPDNLHPFGNWYNVIQWQQLCSVAVAQGQFGKYETLAPNMAIVMEERTNPETGIPEFWVFLRDEVYWAPLQPEFFSSIPDLSPHFLEKHQVTAEDFKFFYDALMNPYMQEPGAVALRTYYAALQEIEVIDKLTFVVRWKAEEVEDGDGKHVKKIKYIAKQLTGGLRPLASFVYKYFANGKKIIEDDSDPNTYLTNSVWAQNFAEHWAKNIIVSCGAWTFDGMTEKTIRFKRNTDFFEPLAALTDEIEVQIKDSPDNIWQQFKAGKLDSYEVRPEQLLELRSFLSSPAYQQQATKGNAIKELDYIMRSYSYIGWNEAKPFFKTAKVRRAMTMAIDRQRIINQILNGQGIEITGTFYRYSPAYDTSIVPLPFDTYQARRLLEEEGWYDSDGDGIIDKVIDGRRTPFSFTLTYYVKNPTTKAICEYVATALREVGVECRLNGVDLADLSANLDDKSYDALVLAWGLGSPPEDPRQLWSSAGAKEKGSSNSIGFVNVEIDKIIDQLDYEYDLEKRVALYHQFDKILYDEQPYTFLYTPKQTLVYREYMQNVFLPIDRQDLVPGANVAEPQSNIFWIKD